MRTHAALLMFVFATAANAAAQPSSTPSRVAGGIQAGATLATVSSYDDTDAGEAFGTGIRGGSTVGGFLTIRISSHVSFQPEAMFVQKGAVLTGGVNDREEARTRLSYVEVPLLLRWEATGGRVRPFVVAGPAFAFSTGSTVDASASGGPGDIDVSSQVRTADAGVAFGGGISQGRLSIGARLVQGFIDIGETADVDRPVRTRTFSMLVGVRF